MLPKLLAVGVALIGGALLGLALNGSFGAVSPGIALLFEFVAFLGLFPALMGLFVSPGPEAIGERIADRELPRPARRRPWKD